MLASGINNYFGSEAILFIEAILSVDASLGIRVATGPTEPTKPPAGACSPSPSTSVTGSAPAPGVPPGARRHRATLLPPKRPPRPRLSRRVAPARALRLCRSAVGVTGRLVGRRVTVTVTQDTKPGCQFQFAASLSEFIRQVRSTGHF